MGEFWNVVRSTLQGQPSAVIVTVLFLAFLGWMASQFLPTATGLNLALVELGKQQAATNEIMRTTNHLLRTTRDVVQEHNDQSKHRHPVEDE